MIAHRLSTVRECGRLFLLENGKLVEEGTFQELIDNNVLFRALAKLERAHESQPRGGQLASRTAPAEIPEVPMNARVGAR
jgi:ABC-type methionine transport system ATPase subunit